MVSLFLPLVPYRPKGEIMATITITYEDGRSVSRTYDGDSSLVHMAHTGALDLLVDALEPLRTDNDNLDRRNDTHDNHRQG